MTTCKLNIQHIPNAYSVPYTLTILDGKINNWKAQKREHCLRQRQKGKLHGV